MKRKESAQIAMKLRWDASRLPEEEHAPRELSGTYMVNQCRKQLSD
jgi:hypothetical protein